MSSHVDRASVHIALGGAGATFALVSGESQLLGGFRVAVAVALLLLAGAPVAYWLLSLDTNPPGWVGGIVFLGTVAAALLSAMLVPPGTAIAPPLWPAAVAAATVVGLRAGFPLALVAGALAGAVNIVSASFSASRLTPELSALQTALLLASLAVPLVAAAAADR